MRCVRRVVALELLTLSLEYRSSCEFESEATDELEEIRLLCFLRPLNRQTEKDNNEKNGAVLL